MNRIIKFSFSCVIFVALNSPGFAAAQAQIQTDNEMLRQGLQLYEELEYERAVEALSAALLEPGNSVEERLIIFQTLGTLYVFLNRQQEAQLALTRLLCVDSNFQFDEYSSPRITEVFRRVREAWIAEGRPCGRQAATRSVQAPVTMDHESPNVASIGDSVDLLITIEDPELRVASVVLFYRASGEEGFNEASTIMTAPGTFAVQISSDVVQPPAVEYFIQAIGDDGNPLAALGTSRAPLRIPVTRGERRRSVVRSWWLWTIIGAVIVGAGLGVGLGLGLNQSPETTSENGSLTVVFCDGESQQCPDE